MRYIRQNTISQLPNDFSSTIHDKKLILVGCGGIGSPLSELLVRGGFLNLTLIDTDIVDESNLQRQNFEESDINNPKNTSLAKRLLSINKKTNINTINEKLTKKNINQICKNSDLILDCTDNFETRTLINDFCEQNKKDWIYSGAIKTEVICCLFIGKNKLFKKVFPKPITNESCVKVGVLASTTFTSASLTYIQILKYFTNNKTQTLIKLNIWTNQIHEIKLK